MKAPAPSLRWAGLTLEMVPHVRRRLKVNVRPGPGKPRSRAPGVRAGQQSGVRPASEGRIHLPSASCCASVFPSSLDAESAPPAFHHGMKQ